MLREALWGKKVNPKTGRMAAHYTCAECKLEFPAKEVQVDHIDPVVVPSEGFVSWDKFISRLFCDKQNLQVLCKPCHKNKTAEEKKERHNESNKPKATRKRNTRL